MNNADEWRELGTKFRVYAKWAGSAFLDSAFLVIWVIVQWVTQRILHNLELSGVDLWMLSVFQVLFALSTLVPVVLYLYVDIRIMILQAQRKIRREVEINRLYETDSSNKR